jgi:hypothetical protein
VFAGEARGAIGREQDMPAVAHDGHGQVDGVPDVPQASNTARAQIRTHHHAGVELDHPIVVEARPDAGVEQRLVLHVAHRRDDSFEGSITDARPALLARSVDGGLAQRELGLGNGPGAAVDDQCRTHARPIRAGY